MKQSCVSAFARAARVLALAAVVLGFGAGSLLGQGATGKIEGRVRDQAGAPIANAQVFIVGTAFNALTNPQGYYFFNNVPASTVSVRAAFIGYRSTQVDRVRVLAGQTITVDIQLEQTAVQIDEITVVTQTQPLVPRDEVTTRQRLDGEVVKELPADRLNQVLALQPGVVASRTANSLSIRGGRSDQNATYVDGVPVQPGYRGTTDTDPARIAGGTDLVVSADAFEQAQVTTGATSAEFGNAQAGIISVATRQGSNDFSGTFSYENDGITGANSLGLNRLSGGFGGPTGISGLTFYLSGTLEGQASLATGKDGDKLELFAPVGIDTVVAVPTVAGDPTADTNFVQIREFALVTGDCSNFEGSTNPDIANNYGVECQGARLPQTPRSSYQASAKLNYSYGTGSRLSLSLLRSQFQGRLTGSDLSWSIFEYPRLTNPTNQFGFRNWSNNVTLNWTQNLSKSAERALALETFLSYQSDNAIAAPLTGDGWRASLDPLGGFMVGGLDFLWDHESFPINDELINNFRTEAPGSRRRPVPPEQGSLFDPTFQYRTNAYGATPANRTTSRPDANFPGEESGGPGGNGVTSGLYEESRYVGKANLDWQADRYNRLRLGGEFIRYNIGYWSAELTTVLFSDAYKEKPIRWNAFIEDRLDLGDVVVVGGLRYDWYDSRASRGAPFPAISTVPGFDPDNPTRDLVRDKSHSYLSPHVQVSFPVTDRTNFRLSYAHQVQSPDFSAIYTGINTDYNRTNPNQLYGSDLDFGRTIAFEFGVRHAFNDDMVLDVAAYNRDVLSDAAGRTISIPNPASQDAPGEVRMITNADFGNTRGVDVRLDRRFGNLFSGTLAYTFQQAKNTGDDPLTYINFGSRIVSAIAGGNTPPPQAILTTASSRPHTLAFAGSLSFPSDFNEGTVVGSLLRNFSVFVTGRYASGTSYSGCVNTQENSVLLTGDTDTSSPCSTGDFTSEINGLRLPAFKGLDARFTKSFGLGGLDLTAYADVRNLLNFTNIARIYQGNNDIENAVEYSADSSLAAISLQGEANANDAFDAETGSIDLSFDGAGAGGCGDWLTAQGSPGAPSCVYLIRAEQRYGDGNGIYSPAEQTRAFNSYYGSFRNRNFFTADPRRVRLGIEVNF
ncbi:MAG TPA: TonB-dependent receptor [Gemmatimonadales bacterium]|nr:TonB-dependent receptor [Gemmatimonadales bacterium]